jgi:hypothetical protein
MIIKGMSFALIHDKILHNNRDKTTAETIRQMTGRFDSSGNLYSNRIKNEN